MGRTPRKRWWVLGVVVATLALPSAAGATGQVYWGDGGANAIGRANLDGSGGGANVPATGATLSQPLGIALDPASNHVYVANNSNSTIVVANLDGSGGGTVLNTTGATVNSPTGVAVDPAGGFVYWANRGGNSISRARIDGSGGGSDLVVGAPLASAPRDVVVDPVANRMYWTNVGTSTIGTANLDGSGAVLLDTTGAPAGVPLYLAGLTATSRLYWTMNAPPSNPLASASLSGGSGSSQPLGPSTSNNNGVAFDVDNDVAFWAKASGQIVSAPLASTASGTNLDLSGSPINNPQGIALLVEPVGAGAPVVTGGTTVGDVLSCDTGTWAGDIPLSKLYRAPRTMGRQWTLDGSDIGSATGPTLTTSAPGDYACRVTATNFAGSTPQFSAPVTVSAPPPPPPPTTPIVAGLSPASGAAGTTVTLTGANFGAVRGVLFDATPASFTVDRFNRIVATAPPHAPGVVRVSVVTTTETSPPTAASAFTYLAPEPSVTPLIPVVVGPSLPSRAAPAPCRVPDVVGRTRASAAARLAAAHCRLGRVTGRGRKVAAQSPKPGAERAADARVSIRLR